MTAGFAPPRGLGSACPGQIYKIPDLRHYIKVTDKVNSYSFTVTTSTQSAQCEADSYATGAPLGALNETACDPATFSFSWTPNGDAGEDGATLKIWDSTTEQFATRDIPADEIHMHPEYVLGAHPYSYSGPSDFTVETQLD